MFLWYGQTRHPPNVLAAWPELLACCGEHGHAATPAHVILNQGRGGAQYTLAVVEHNEDIPVREPPRSCLSVRLTGDLADPDGRHDGARYQIGIGEPGQAHDPGPLPAASPGLRPQPAEPSASYRTPPDPMTVTTPWLVNTRQPRRMPPGEARTNRRHRDHRRRRQSTVWQPVWRALPDRGANVTGPPGAPGDAPLWARAGPGCRGHLQRRNGPTA
jgi:hypothetical protein